MKTGFLTVNDPMGMHARPAGQLVQALRSCGAETRLSFGEKQADGSGLFSVMALGAKHGDTIRITLSGENCDAAAENIKRFCEETPAFSAEF